MGLKFRSDKNISKWPVVPENPIRLDWHLLYQILEIEPSPARAIPSMQSGIHPGAGWDRVVGGSFHRRSPGPDVAAILGLSWCAQLRSMR